MSVEQHDDFRKRRSDVIRTHLRNDPKIRAGRRRMRVRFMLGVASYTVVLAVTLIFAKSVTMAIHDARSYRLMVAPVIRDLPDTHIGHTLLMPDPISTQISAFLRPYINAGTREHHAGGHGRIVTDTRQTVPLSLQDQN
ncbi:hypothetical protein [Roseinatronobacter sp. S2]|uniref:hypothetical protein n=1 Tax=Roseinatronobacter sp. S2 TaxID=3035471 RepID=UPI0024100B82|nr:hypothetical protein [Roseinatronobacter sp. S2]WFE74990.1 hypothetical protein P8S53_00900 [Roseinatronobacter sp. S2]